MSADQWKLSSYDYDLPKELIAQYPSPIRDQSRMLFLDRKTGKILDKNFSDIVSILPSSSCLVVNNTKVLPARMHGTRKTGGKIEALLIEEIEKGKWKAIVSKSRRIQNGETIEFCEGKLLATFDSRIEKGVWILIFRDPEKFKDRLEKFGLPPLPPYVTKNRDNDLYHEEDKIRYQTCYASVPGAIAAPTAGLHFTPEILKKIKDRGIEILEVTLHIGLGTFTPVKNEDIRKHKMHSEFFSVSSKTLQKIKLFRENHKKVISIGTTSVRVLETLAQKNFKVDSRQLTVYLLIFIYQSQL